MTSQPTLAAVPAPLSWPLTRSLDPLPDESLASYLRRLAGRLDRSPSDLSRRIGMGQSGRVPAYFALRLPNQVLDAFTTACRLTVEEGRRLTIAAATDAISVPAELNERSLLQAAARVWIRPGLTKYCSACLTGDGDASGYWRMSWQLPWHFACPRHAVFLADTCPACGTPVGVGGPSGLAGGVMPNPGVPELPLDACRQRSRTTLYRGPVCGHRLSTATAMQDSAPPEVLQVQAQLAAVLGPHPSPGDAGPPLIAGEPVSHQTWAAALHDVAVLIRGSLGLPDAPPADPAVAHLADLLEDPTLDHQRRRALLHPYTEPDSAAAAAALLTPALGVLTAPSHAELDERLSLYREPVRQHAPGLWKQWLRTFPDPALKRLVKRNRRWGWLGLVAPATGRTGLRGEHLSQRISAPHDRLLAPYQSLRCGDSSLHRATAVLLYQKCEAGVSRQEAAAALGFYGADRYADKYIDWAIASLQRDLHRANLTADYLRTLTLLEAALAAEPPINWTKRFFALRDWTLPPTEWEELKAGLAPLQKRTGRQPDWDLRRLVISQIFYEDLTRAEPHRSAAFAAIGVEEHGRTRLRRTSLQFRHHVETGVLAGFAPILDRYRAQLEATL